MTSAAPRRRVLMLAFHYPPYFGSSGILRTLKFSKYLPENGWDCTVLTASPRAYGQSQSQPLEGVPSLPGVTVVRSFALDTAVHLSVAGRYPEWLALPDRWASWWPSATLAGLRTVRRLRPDLIWSTYPIASAHLIALTLAKLTGLPWVADFRDSMTEESYPADPLRRRVYRWIERKTVERAARVIFTTPSTLRMYRERYPAAPADRFVMISNGFDEENFESIEARPVPGPISARPVKLLHTGVLYPHERDPTAFFAAVAALRNRGAVNANNLQIILRATGHDPIISSMIRSSDVSDIVQLAPPIRYEESIREMADADGLLVFQAANSNHQVPAKIYEYMRAGRPILGITDPAGDTAVTLREAGIDSLARLDDAEEITRELQRFVVGVRDGTARGADREVTRRYARRSQATDLAAVLAGVAARRPG